MKVLIACEFSGVVRDAFANQGHDAWSCDILPTERPGNHIQEPVQKIDLSCFDLMIERPFHLIEYLFCGLGHFSFLMLSSLIGGHRSSPCHLSGITHVVWYASQRITGCKRHMVVLFMYMGNIIISVWLLTHTFSQLGLSGLQAVRMNNAAKHNISFSLTDLSRLSSHMIHCLSSFLSSKIVFVPLVLHAWQPIKQHMRTQHTAEIDRN